MDKRKFVTLIICYAFTFILTANRALDMVKTPCEKCVH
jgi:hypothetical protein